MVLISPWTGAPNNRTPLASAVRKQQKLGHDLADQSMGRQSNCKLVLSPVEHQSDRKMCFDGGYGHQIRRISQPRIRILCDAGFAIHPLRHEPMYAIPDFHVSLVAEEIAALAFVNSEGTAYQRKTT